MSKKSFVSDLIRILKMDCKESSMLASESLDRSLRVSEKLAMWLHYIVCWSCRRLKRHMRFISKAAKRLELRSRDDMLSEIAADRIKAALNRARGK